MPTKKEQQEAYEQLSLHVLMSILMEHSLVSHQSWLDTETKAYRVVTQIEGDLLFYGYYYWRDMEQPELTDKGAAMVRKLRAKYP